MWTGLAVFIAIAVSFFVYAYAAKGVVREYWIGLGIALGVAAGLAIGLVLDFSRSRRR